MYDHEFQLLTQEPAWLVIEKPTDRKLLATNGKGDFRVNIELVGDYPVTVGDKIQIQLGRTCFSTIAYCILWYLEADQVSVTQKPDPPFHIKIVV